MWNFLSTPWLHSKISTSKKEMNRPATHSKHLLQVHSNLLVQLKSSKDSYWLVLHHQQASLLASVAGEGDISCGLYPDPVKDFQQKFAETRYLKALKGLWQKTRGNNRENYPEMYMLLHITKLQVLLFLHARKPKLQEFANITLNSLWISAFGSSSLFNLAIN